MDSRTEPRELPGAARERAHSESERAIAERWVVAGPRRVEDDITARRSKNLNRLEINDLRVDLDCFEVRGRDRTEGAGPAGEPGALLLHTEISTSRRERCGDRRSSGSLIAARRRGQARRSCSRGWTCRKPGSVGTPGGGQRP